MFLRLSFFLRIPKIMMDVITTKIDRNPYHDGKRNLSGEKKVASDDSIKF